MTQTRVKNNKIEVFTKDKNIAREIQTQLSALTPGHEFDTRFRRGVWDGRCTFYKVQKLKDSQGWVFTVPAGFAGRVERIIKDPGQKLTPKIDVTSPAGWFKSIRESLPFQPYKHQLRMFLNYAEQKNHMGLACTGSGKSYVIYLLTRYYLETSRKVCIVVPTIDLTNQIHQDFEDYGSTFQDKIQRIGGEYNKKEINPETEVIITTYQSGVKAKITDFDVCITDECHLAKAESLLKILKYPFTQRLGMTGSNPPDPLDRLKLEQNFGYPVTYITSRQLIDLGLATNVVIHPLFLQQQQKIMKYQDEVKYVKEDTVRRKFVTKLLKKLPSLTVVLYNHTEHGLSTFNNLVGISPEKKEQQKIINDFDYQKENGVFFLYGGTKAKTRKDILEYVKKHDGSSQITLIGQTKLLSTGINIKSLKNLVFVASTKSYTSIIQSIGRVMRLHGSKNIAQVWDLVDDFTYRHGRTPRLTENHSLKHYTERLFYYTEQQLEVQDREILLK